MAYHKGDLRYISGVVVRSGGHTFHINGIDRRWLGKRLCQCVWDWTIFHAALMTCGGLCIHQRGFPHVIWTGVMSAEAKASSWLTLVRLYAVCNNFLQLPDVLRNGCLSGLQWHVCLRDRQDWHPNLGLLSDTISELLSTSSLLSLIPRACSCSCEALWILRGDVVHVPSLRHECTAILGSMGQEGKRGRSPSHDRFKVFRQITEVTLSNECHDSR